jgi:hypothetical protein
MGPHRDDLEAAHARLQQLEGELAQAHRRIGQLEQQEPTDAGQSTEPFAPPPSKGSSPFSLVGQGSAPRIVGNIRYQHPWSYFPQWHFLRESVRDFLLYRPSRETRSILLLLLIYPLWLGLFYPLFFLLALPLFVPLCVLATPLFLLKEGLSGLKLSVEELPRRRERVSAIALRHGRGGPLYELQGEGRGDKASTLFLLAITLGPVALGLLSLLV